MQFCSYNSYSQMKAYCIQGSVTYVDDLDNLLQGNVLVGDSITGKVIYDLNAVDNNPMAQVADYQYNAAPSGFYLNIGNRVFKTDVNNVNLLYELVNDYNGYDNILFSSYNNVFIPDIPAFSSDNHIAWQLDDTNQVALSNTGMPSHININVWQQSSGLTIEGGSLDSSIFIRAIITTADTCDYLTAVENLVAAKSHIVYPNPFNASTTVKFKSAVNDISLAIYNIYGQKIRTITNISGDRVTINRENLQNGTYYIVFTEQDKTISTSKIIITD